jgi:NAD(P)-dependent dehydrogenase (short-subunit alcohol dehydrogenase family)
MEKLMERVSNKIALVTGATSGIGKAIAIKLASEGADVVVTGRNREAGQEVVLEINKKREKSIYVDLDVTQESDWEVVLNIIAKKYNRLDILVNNAGITIAKRIEDTSLEEWRKIMEVNLDSVFIGTKACVPIMRGTGRGSIINISSVLGITAAEMVSAYTASKAAVRLFTKCSALELAVDKIRVNSIHPAFIHTPMMEKTALTLYGSVSKGKAEFDKLHPIGKIGNTDDIANAALYLASDESSFSTGSELVIDGGYTAR